MSERKMLVDGEALEWALRICGTTTIRIQPDTAAKFRALTPQPDGDAIEVPEDAAVEAAYLVKACTEVDALRAENERLRAALRGLLLSADCSWEERRAGHDWREACEAARKALGLEETR